MAHDDSDIGTTRGNPTKVERWLSGGSYLGTTLWYDTTGQVKQVRDPKGVDTYLSYTDVYYTDNGLNPPNPYSPGVTTNAYVTTVTLPITGTLSFGYYYPTGKLARQTEQNSQNSYLHFMDSLDRLTQTVLPDGGGTDSSYPSARVTDVYTRLTGTSSRRDQVSLDTWGRQVQSALLSDPDGNTFVDTTYDSLGRVSSVSNPYRGGQNGVELFGYDGLDRTTQVTRADGSIARTYYGAAVGGGGGAASQLCAAGTYGIDYPTLFVDEAGKKRQIWTDGLGRSIEADEPDSSNNLTGATCYKYDLLDNLTLVVQGSQTRSYSYDGLSRLSSAATPEAGTTYTYYTTSGGALCAGDLNAVCRRTDPRSITTTYNYDALNRLTSKTYSDTTPAAYFYYDETSVTLGSWTSPTLTNTKGRLSHTEARDGSTLKAATVYSYDSVGRVNDYWQCAPNNCGSSAIWNTHYNYNLAGDVSSWTHPAGFTIMNNISTARRISQITSSRADPNPPTLATLTYTPFGSISTLVNGCAGGGCVQRQETYDYNKRFQPAMIQLGVTGQANANFCLVYNYYPEMVTPTSCAVPSPGASGNNGNVLGYFYQDSTNPSQQHKTDNTYDTLNRLTSSIATPVAPGTAAYNLRFAYDQYGNMRCVTDGQTSGPCPNWTFDQTTNRINTAGFAYDAAGDVTSDGSCDWTWDAEGQLKTMGRCRTKTFTYNALGDFVDENETAPANYRQIFLWDPWGKLHGTYDGRNGGWWQQNIVLGNRMVAWYIGPAAMRFPHPNNILSSTMVTDQTGAVIHDQIYYPWGQRGPQVGGADYHFASLLSWPGVRDMWLASFRIHHANHGRWMKPDLLAGDVMNPQSLNRYAYVVNNPTNFIDPLGLQGGSFWAETWDPCSDPLYMISHAECPGLGYPGRGCLMGGFCPPGWPPIQFPPGGGTGGGGSMPGNAQNPPSTTIPWPPGNPTAPITISVLLQTVLRGLTACMGNPYCAGAVLVGAGAVAAYTGYRIYQARKADLRLVDEAMRQIQKRCGRQFSPEEYEKVRQDLHDAFHEPSWEGGGIGAMVEIGVGIACPGK